MSLGEYRTSVRISATPADVFQCFTDPTLIVRWMGDWADLDPTVDGQFTVDINGIPIRGRYLHVEPPHRVVFTWGAAGNDLIPPHSTTVDITLTADGLDTVVELVHSQLPPDAAAEHRIGWEHFLARLVIAGAGADPGPDPWATDTPPPATAGSNG